jgi:hypothetical protein
MHEEAGTQQQKQVVALEVHQLTAACCAGFLNGCYAWYMSMPTLLLSL